MSDNWAIFSSDDLSEKEPFDVWCEMFSRRMLGFDVLHVDPRPFFTAASFFSLGAVKITSMTSTGEHYHRSRSLIAEDGRDDIALAICRAGSCEIEQGRSRVLLRKSEATLFDGGHVMEGRIEPASIAEHQEMTNLCLPRAELLRRVPKAEQMLLKPCCGQEQLRLLSSYLDMVRNNDYGRAPDVNEIIGGHIIDIIAFMLGGREIADAATGGVRAARLAALRKYIESHYTEHHLSADDIAAAMKISRRYLYDLLDDTGESITQVLNRLRLNRARKMLGDPRYSHLSIAEIAFESGFGDLSYFYRRFRLQFDDVPGEFRRRNMNR
ncbi:helix-turn-helix domain-containing protein [Methylococcus mesophilus]|uniref:helix-turn-helix domain-containing protein n=1 Tax=Methylococcus mesophilus TaxID=2993564 RepID=UPI00224A5776|nr:helix-turn-helix domain-containing protein [Methylococcus mesophilus]UZR27254.1 helix-turn-helix domain-containing protein [Methylococcus mesophilus]